MKFPTLFTAVLAGAVLAAPAPAPEAAAAPGELLRQTLHREPTCREAYDDCERDDYKICCPYNDKCRTFDDDDLRKYGNKKLSSWCKAPRRYPKAKLPQASGGKCRFSLLGLLLGSTCPKNIFLVIPISICEPYYY